MTTPRLPAPPPEPRIIPHDNNIEKVVLGARILYGGQAIPASARTRSEKYNGTDSVGRNKKDPE